LTPDDFRRWRKSLGLKQRDAAKVLGLKKRIIQYYERGRRDGKQLSIPLTVALACYAVANGVFDYDASEFPDE
jgi:transcriptional regulator with XRE-family HTH domain